LIAKLFLLIAAVQTPSLGLAGRGNMSNTYPWLSYPAQAAIEKIQAEQERGSAKGSVSGKGTGKGKGMTGRSPPSSSYASVVTLRSLHLILDG